MKIVKQNIALNKAGSVKIILEEHDDLWLIYNLLAKGDTIVSETTRKVVVSKSSDNIGGRKDSSRVKIILKIQITDFEYEKDSSMVRVRGRNLVTNQFMSFGTYHTLEIERNQEFVLSKEIWDSDAIETLNEATEKSSAADLAVIILQQGSVQVFLVGYQTTLCAKIEDPTVPSDKFYERVLQVFVKHVDFSNVRCVVLGSPGCLKEEFRDYMFQEAQRLRIKSIQENKSRIVMVNIGKKDGLKEILLANEVMGSIKNTIAAVEIKAYKEVSDLLVFNADRTCYGPRNVETALELKAIKTLFITDDLLRSKEIALRQKYTELVKSVKKTGGQAFVLSSMNVSGQQLAQLTGIAAILRFPLPDLDELVI